jgi:hypothetical protein
LQQKLAASVRGLGYKFRDFNYFPAAAWLLPCDPGSTLALRTTNRKPPLSAFGFPLFPGQ